MKKIFSLLLVLFVMFAFAACGKDNAGKDKDVYVKYYSDASELLPVLKQGATIKTGLLPEPAASKLVGMSDCTIKLDVQKLYGGDYPQAVLVVKKSVAESDSAFVAALVAAIGESAEWIAANDENAASAVDAINAHVAQGVTPSLDKTSITKKVVENCNVYFEAAADAKKDVADYLAAVKDIDGSSANALADAFYYSAPTEETEDADAEYKIAMPDGAPALAMAKLIADNAQFGRTVTYTVVAAANIGPQVVQKTADVAILPVTAASKTIGNGENYVMLGVVTHGNLFIVGSEDIATVNDLCGKTVGVIVQGQVPDLTFRAILKKNGLNYKIAE